MESPAASKVPIALVQMPYADLERPSLALGLLKARLREGGLACRTYYANLDFAERVGLEPLRLLRQIPEHFLAGEWTFARAAFPDYDAPPGFLEQLRARSGFEADLEPLRPVAERFVEELARRLVAEGYAVVGCTSTFQQHCASLALLRQIKRLAPQVKTVLGGANCEGDMGAEALRSFGWLDAVVSGEADDLVVPLMGELLHWPRGPRNGLPPGALVGSPPAALVPRAKVRDLDALPVPDFDDYFEQLGRSPLQPAIHPGLVLEGSRGCWWGQKHHCTFCGLNGQGMGYRAKSGPRILQEMEQLHERHRIAQFEMVDNILDMKGFQTFLPELARRRPPFSLFYEVKANLSRDQLSLLAQAGVGWVQPGLESLDDRVLKLLDKGTTTLANLRFLRLAREFGVRVTWLILSQVPGEEDAWYEETARWLPRLSHLQPPTRAVRVRYDRFSPYHQNPERFGLKIEPDSSYRYVYPSDVDLDKLAYFFDDAPGSCPPGREGPEGRAGLSALQRQVLEWNQRFWRWPDLLCQTETEAGLEILDTRPIAVERRSTLRGVARELLLACDAPHPREKLLRRFGPQAQPALEELEARGLILEQNGRILALPVPGRIPTLARRSDFPGGRTLAKTS